MELPDENRRRQDAVHLLQFTFDRLAVRSSCSADAGTFRDSRLAPIRRIARRTHPKPLKCTTTGLSGRLRYLALLFARMWNVTACRSIA